MLIANTLLRRVEFGIWLSNTTENLKSHSASPRVISNFQWCLSQIPNSTLRRSVFALYNQPLPELAGQLPQARRADCGGQDLPLLPDAHRLSPHHVHPQVYILLNNHLSNHDNFDICTTLVKIIRCSPYFPSSCTSSGLRSFLAKPPFQNHDNIDIFTTLVKIIKWSFIPKWTLLFSGSPSYILSTEAFGLVRRLQ